LRLFSFGGYGLALAALALVVFGAHESYPTGLPKTGQFQLCSLARFKVCPETIQSTFFSKQVSSDE